MEALCKLINGEFPVKHPSNYVDSADRVAFPIMKPTLRATETKIAIIINVVLNTWKSLMLLQEVIPNSIIFDTIISGVSLPWHPLEHHKQAHKFFNRHSYDNIMMNLSARIMFDSDKHQITFPGVRSNGCLWLDDCGSPSKMARSFVHKVLMNSTSPISLVSRQPWGNFFFLLPSMQSVSWSSISIQPQLDKFPEAMIKHIDLFNAVLSASQNVLQYLQLASFPVSLVPNISLKICSNLRVLSITARSTAVASLNFVKNTVTHFFYTLQSLQNLEYFLWSESINLVKDHLISMNHVLTTSLPNLAHWHMRSCKIMLSTTDLMNPDCQVMVELLEQLVGNKTKDASCDTYLFSICNLHFIHWLESARPNVCFNCQAREDRASFNSCPYFC